MTKKIIPYILIVFIIVTGFLGLTNQTYAQARCWDSTNGLSFPLNVIGTEAACLQMPGNTWGTTSPSTTTQARCWHANAEPYSLHSMSSEAACLQIPGNTWGTSPPRVNTDITYRPLAPLPGLERPLNTADPSDFGNYLNIMIKLIIGLIAVSAVVMIFFGGIEYMTSEIISNKEHGKERIRNALFGLLLALGSYALLNEINPDLLKTDLLRNAPDAIITIFDNANSVIPKTTGSCTPVTSGSCTPANLSVFGSNANDASKICNVESAGQADRVSGGDRCNNSPLLTFSYGLFQINLIAHGDKVTGTDGSSCTGLFVKNDGTAISGGDYINGRPNGPYSYNCKLNPGQGQRLVSCANALKNPTTNIAIAYQLFQARRNPLFADWYLSDRNRCGGSVSGW